MGMSVLILGLFKFWTKSRTQSVLALKAAPKSEKFEVHFDSVLETVGILNI